MEVERLSGFWKELESIGAAAAEVCMNLVRVAWHRANGDFDETALI
jgi:hypothetical protein